MLFPPLLGDGGWGLSLPTESIRISLTGVKDFLRTGRKIRWTTSNLARVAYWLRECWATFDIFSNYIYDGLI